MSRTDGGTQTTRLSEQEQAKQIREDRQDAARRVLIRTGHADLLPVLGLGDAPTPESAADQPEPDPALCITGGQPSSWRYRKHRAAGEDCPACMGLMRARWTSAARRRGRS